MKEWYDNRPSLLLNLELQWSKQEDWSYNSHSATTGVTCMSMELRQSQNMPVLQSEAQIQPCLRHA